MHSLNEQQLAFAAFYTSDPDTSGNGAASAVKAGYAISCAKQIAHKLLRHEGVRSEIDRLCRAEIGNLASLSIRRLRQILEDDRTSYKIYLEAIKTTLDRAGIIAPRAQDAPEIGHKPFARMSIAELERYVVEGHERIERERTAIDVTPIAIEAGPAAG